MAGIRLELTYPLVLIGVCGRASGALFAVPSGVAGPLASVWRYVIGAAGLLVLAPLTWRNRDLITPLREDGMRLVPLSLIGISGLCAVGGVALLLTDGYLDTLVAKGDSLIGVLLALCSVVLISSYTVLVRPLIVKHGAIRITTISHSIGALGLWLIVGAAWGVWVDPFSVFERSPTATWSLLTLALWNTTITQLLWLTGLALVPDITRGSYLFFLKPAIAAGLALAFLMQPITAVQVLAIVVICSSVFAEMFGARPVAARR